MALYAFIFKLSSFIANKTRNVEKTDCEPISQMLTWMTFLLWFYFYNLNGFSQKSWKSIVIHIYDWFWIYKNEITFPFCVDLEMKKILSNF